MCLLMKRNGQSTIEFVILVTAVLFFFVGFLVFIQERIALTNYESMSVALYELAATVQDEISLASSSADGYSRQFNIPASLNGLPYSINITDDSVYIRTSDGRHALALPVGEITGDVIIGVNLIEKSNGFVMLNP